jgi:hypothetical protein
VYADFLLSVIFALAIELKRPIMSSLSMVVARYREDVTWIKDFMDLYPNLRVYLYLKGPELTEFERASLPDSVVVRHLPNVGRCDHTFLYHIITEYDCLTDVTVFASGAGSDTRKGPKISRVTRIAAETGDTVFMGLLTNDVAQDHGAFQLDAYISSNEVNRKGEGGLSYIQPSPLRPFGAWYASQFPTLINVPIRVICWMSIFAVHRRHVRQHVIQWYKELEEQIATHSSPEIGHYIERSWAAIFWPYPASCVYSA